MAKAIKTALIAAAIVTLIVMIPPVGAALTAPIAGLSVAVGFGVMTFATTLISAGIGMLTSKGIEANNANFGTKTSTRGAINARQIIYGETRVGGTITFMRSTGTDNNKLSMMIVIAGHEIEEIVSVNINETTVTTTAATSSGAGTDNKIHTVTDSKFTNTDNENNFGSGRLIRFTKHDGSQTTFDSLARATHGSTVIDSNFKLSGCAYLYFEMIYDSEKLPQIPKITMRVKGKKLYDPRLDSTVGGSGSQRLSTPSTHTWSDNPALCVLDYLSDTTYGIKSTSTELNLSANAGGFMSAANTCEQTVSNIGGVSEERYTANGFTNMSADGNGIIEGLLSACGGKLTFTNGMFNIFVAAAQTPSLTITDDDILQPITVTKNTQSNELFNSVKAVFVDKNNNFVATDTPELTNSTFVAEDVPTGEANANYLKRMELQLPYTQTSTTAERLSKIALQHQRQALQVSVTVTTKYLRLQPADFVYITNERLNFSQKMFEVISTELVFLDNDGVPCAATQLNLKEISSAVYDFVSNDYVTPVTQGPVTEVPAGSFEMSQPSSLSLSQVLTLDGTTSKINIKASWTNSTSPYLFGTEVSYKLSTDSAYQAIVVGAGTSQAFIPNVTAGDQYNVRVRHFSDRNVYSAYTSNVNITIAAASAAPSDPSSLTASTGKALNIVVQYTNPNNSDLKAVKIYRKTTNSTPSSDSDGLVHTQYGAPNAVTTFLDGKHNGLSAGVTHFYWVRAVNHSDVHSNFVGSVQGNFTSVDTGDLADNAITETKIEDDAITTPKIEANAVTANEINVNNLAAISADMGTITAGSITAGSVAATTLNLNGTSLTANSSGLSLNNHDIFAFANSGSIGTINGIAGQDVGMTSVGEQQSSLFLDTDPKHISDTTTTVTTPHVTAGNVMGGLTNNANGPVLMSFNFTTAGYSGTKKFIVMVHVNPIGSYGSSSESMFAFAMRATTSSTNYTSTNANDYIVTRGTSIGGSNAGAPYTLSAIVDLQGNTEHYIWVFGGLDDVGSAGHALGLGFLDGMITVTGLNA